MKENPPALKPPVLRDTRTLPLEQATSSRARELWEKYGRPQGQDVAIWLEAERQVLGVDGAVNSAESAPVAADELKNAITPPCKPPDA